MPLTTLKAPQINLLLLINTVSAIFIATTAVMAKPFVPDLLNKGKICTYSDTLNLSDTNPKYERIFQGLSFQKGSGEIIMTATNDEGSNVSGGVSVEQTDGGEYNRNLVLPASGLGSSIVTPITKKLVKQVAISGNGKGYLRVEFGQNGNGKPKVIRYKLILQGSGIANCGSS